MSLGVAARTRAALNQIDAGRWEVAFVGADWLQITDRPVIRYVFKNWSRPWTIVEAYTIAPFSIAPPVRLDCRAV